MISEVKCNSRQDSTIREVAKHRKSTNEHMLLETNKVSLRTSNDRLMLSSWVIELVGFLKFSIEKYLGFRKAIAKVPYIFIPCENLEIFEMANNKLAGFLIGWRTWTKVFFFLLKLTLKELSSKARAVFLVLPSQHFNKICMKEMSALPNLQFIKSMDK